MKLSKRQRALFKREKRRPAREKRKARQRREHNKVVRKNRQGMPTDTVLVGTIAYGLFQRMRRLKDG